MTFATYSRFSNADKNNSKRDKFCYINLKIQNTTFYLLLNRCLNNFIKNFRPTLLFRVLCRWVSVCQRTPLTPRAPLKCCHTNLEKETFFIESIKGKLSGINLLFAFAHSSAAGGMLSSSSCSYFYSLSLEKEKPSSRSETQTTTTVTTTQKNDKVERLNQSE